jgi:hypothetical protein
MRSGRIRSNKEGVYPQLFGNYFFGLAAFTCWRKLLLVTREGDDLVGLLPDFRWSSWSWLATTIAMSTDMSETRRVFHGYL